MIFEYGIISYDESNSQAKNPTKQNHNQLLGSHGTLQLPSAYPSITYSNYDTQEQEEHKIKFLQSQRLQVDLQIENCKTAKRLKKNDNSIPPPTHTNLDDFVLFTNTTEHPEETPKGKPALELPTHSFYPRKSQGCARIDACIDAKIKAESRCRSLQSTTRCNDMQSSWSFVEYVRGI